MSRHFTILIARVMLVAGITIAPGVVIAAAEVADADTGYRIAERSQQVLFGYQTLSADWQMTITKNDRETGKRSFEVKLKEQPASGEHDLALVTINAPVALRGTKLLSWSSGEGDDQQWLYTPRSERTRRIGDRGRHASFVNSTFSFEDLLKWQLEAYQYSSRGSAECPAGTCQLVSATPAKRTSKYARLDLYYDDLDRVSRINYFREADATEPWKTLTVHAYEEVGPTWQPARSEMVDHENGSATLIEASTYVLDAELAASDFAPNNL